VNEQKEIAQERKFHSAAILLDKQGSIHETTRFYF
jgi:hypothetical protein